MADFPPLPNRKRIIAKLMRSRLEIIMKIKVMKEKKITSTKLKKMYNTAEKLSTRLCNNISHIIVEHVKWIESLDHFYIYTQNKNLLIES